MPADDPSGHQTVTETLASNVRGFRQLRGLEQDKLAQRMQALGHMWRQVTVSEVERQRRNITAPELVALTLALGANIAQLLDPRGPERIRGPRLALLDQPESVTGVAGEAVSGPTGEPMVIPTIAPDDVEALICSHHSHAVMDWEWDNEGHYLRGVDIVQGYRPDLGPERARS